MALSGAFDIGSGNFPEVSVIDRPLRQVSADDQAPEPGGDLRIVLVVPRRHHQNRPVVFAEFSQTFSTRFEMLPPAFPAPVKCADISSARHPRQSQSSP